MYYKDTRSWNKIFVIRKRKHMSSWRRNFLFYENDAVVVCAMKNAGFHGINDDKRFFDSTTARVHDCTSHESRPL